MSNISCISVGNSLRELGVDIVEEGAKIYDEASFIAHYLLSAYEAISGMIGLGCYHSARAALSGSAALLKAAGKGIIWIDRKIGSASAHCGYATFRLLSALEMGALRINDLFNLAVSACGYALYAASAWVSRNVATAAAHTARFVKNNWKQTIGYILAWSVVIVCSGALYGFQAVALPLTIGFAVGLGIGGITGMLTNKIFDPQDQYRGKNTIWDLLNFGIEQLDPNGTRQIVTAISVTVLLAASVIFPYALGGIFGLLVGNQVITKIGFNRDLGPDPLDQRRQVQDLRRQLQGALHRLDELEGLEGHEH
jgi:hypothetical protein